MPKQYIETENRRPTHESVSTSPILPRWFSNQWLTGSLVAPANFYFLQCRARGATLLPQTDFRALWLTARLAGGFHEAAFRRWNGVHLSDCLRAVPFEIV